MDIGFNFHVRSAGAPNQWTPFKYDRVGNKKRTDTLPSDDLDQIQGGLDRRSAVLAELGIPMLKANVPASAAQAEMWRHGGERLLE